MIGKGVHEVIQLRQRPASYADIVVGLQQSVKRSGRGPRVVCHDVALTVLTLMQDGQVRPTVLSVIYAVCGEPPSVRDKDRARHDRYNKRFKRCEQIVLCVIDALNSDDPRSRLGLP